MLPWIALALGALSGALIGSYGGTLLARWPRGESATFGRSRCDSCAAPLGATQLVPVLSFLVQRGRCRRCAAAIAPGHLWIELGAMTVGGISGLLFADTPATAAASAVAGWLLLLLAAFDLRHFWLPDRLVLPLAALGLAVNALGIGPGLTDAVIGALGGFLALWAIARGYRLLRGREGLGGGDPKMLGAIGAWIGWQALPFTVFLAALLGLLAAGILALRGRAVDGEFRLPLGAALAAAAWPLWLWGLLAGP